MLLFNLGSGGTVCAPGQEQRQRRAGEAQAHIDPQASWTAAENPCGAVPLAGVATTSKNTVPTTATRASRRVVRGVGQAAADPAVVTGPGRSDLDDRLVRRGPAGRGADPADRRRVVSRVVDQATTDALDVQTSSFTPFAKRMTDLITSYPPAHRAVLFESFDKVTAGLRRVTAELQEGGRGGGAEDTSDAESRSRTAPTGAGERGPVRQAEFRGVP